LIYGASGSLGTAAVQIAKSMGAKVTGVCSTKNLDLVKKLGADEVIDYKKEDFSKNGKKYDVVYDTVGKINIEKAAESIKPEGFLMHSVGTPANTSRIKKALKGTDKKYIGGTPTMDKDYIEKIKKFVEEKRPDPVIDRTYNLEEIVEAHRYVEKGHKVGNVVVKVP
jgi:NADPH:quinone reductase-like Zn-dependent oxidoreductase